MGLDGGSSSSSSAAEIDKLLSRFYYGPTSAAAFSGAQALHRAVTREGHKISIKMVRHWLNKQPVNQLHKPARSKFQRRHTYVFSLWEMAQADLADVSSLASANGNVRFLLVLINAFSRKLYVKPLKRKTGAEVAQKLGEILDGLRPNSFKFLQTDQGE